MLDLVPKLGAKRLNRRVLFKKSELFDELIKSWPVARLVLPAVSHYEIDIDRTKWRLLHAIALLDEPQKRLDVVQIRVGRLGERGNLPQEHTERPDVRLAREQPDEERFGRHPLHGQQSV